MDSSSVACSSSHGEQQRPSSSRQKSMDKVTKRKGRDRRNKILSIRIRKLEKKMELYQRKIRQIMETEVTLEEMDSDTSAYLHEDVLKRHFLKAWDEWCDLLRVSPEIQMGSEKRIKNCDNFTEYPAINRRLNRLLQQGEFPNFYDVYKLIERVNEKHGLGLKKSELESFSKPVFKKVGEKMKQQRQEEWRHLFGSHLTDSNVVEDPATADEDLQQKLTSNYDTGEMKMMALFDEYADRQKCEGDASANSEDDEDSSEGKPIV